MADQVSIVNRALLSFGARAQVSSINPSDGSTEADAAAVLYTPTFESLARTAHWNCLRKQVTLSLLAAATGTPENPLGTTLPLPPSPWLYSYQYPADCLAMRFIVPSLPSATGGISETSATVYAPSCIPNDRQIPFAVAYAVDSTNSPITVILTNQTQAQAVYTVNQPNPVIWDSQFQQAMVLSLAAFLIPALALNIPLMQASIKAVDNMIMQARVADGVEGVTSQTRDASWISARQYDQGYFGGYGYGGLYCGFSNMSWPSYG